MEMRVDCNSTIYILHDYNIKEVYVNPNSVVENLDAGGDTV